MTKLAILISGLSLACVGCGQSRTRIAEAIEYEPETPKDCASYAGRVSGNDANMDVKLVLCPTSTGLEGWIRFMSRESGWSIRELQGQVSSDGTLVLRDTGFLENHPTAGWRLCLVDQYVLRQRGPGEAQGSYTSSECRDTATMVVRRAGP